MSWDVMAVLLIFGLTWGSFLNVCIHRIPLRQSIVFPASHCPACDTPIAWRDNIPVFSWLALRGRCRSCRGRISHLYPLVELLTGLLTLHVVHWFGLTPEGAALMVLAYAFLVLLVIDLYHYILPDVITLPGMVLGVVLAALPWFGPPLASLEDSLIGVAAGGGGLWAFAWTFEKLTKKEGMGFGDVKLFALIGAWLGWQALPFTIFAGSLVGSIVGILWMVIAGRDRNQKIPFGPYLVLGAWVFLLYGMDFYAWYFGALG